MSTAPATPAKTIGDYGVEVQKAVINGSCAGVEAVVVEMRATLPPVDPNAPPPAPPAPVNQGVKAYADQLEACVQSNNVFKAGELASEMIKVEPPTPPPTSAGSAGSATSGTGSGTSAGISGGSATSGTGTSGTSGTSGGISGGSATSA